MKEKMTTLRISPELDEDIEKLARLRHTERSKIIRELLVLGLKAKKLEEAIILYSEGRVSLWRAARIAEVSLWKMIEIVSERKIDIQYSERELKEDLKALNDNL
jgi:predicted HTH domain antitoxin